MEERLRILLCEDDENLGMLLREYLQSKGYAADSSPMEKSGYKHSGKVNIRFVRTRRDVHKKDGFTLAQETVR